MSAAGDDYPPHEIRTPREVARRTLALFAVVGLALKADRALVLDWLTESDLWAELTPRERGFVDNPEPPRKQTIDMSWQSERIMVLLWALDLVAAIPAADTQCDTSEFQTILPPFAEKTVVDFIAEARLRSEDELLGMQDKYLSLHWAARDARIHGRSAKMPVDIEVIQERHHAINWVCGYDSNTPWDDVTTDT